MNRATVEAILEQLDTTILYTKDTGEVFLLA